MQAIAMPLSSFITKFEVVLAITWAKAKHCFDCSAKQSSRTGDFLPLLRYALFI